MPLKYVPTSKFTLAEKGATCIAMKSGIEKRCITRILSITLSNEFLPMQLIYEKTVQSLPRSKFPQEFSLSTNPIHFSNSSESVKLFEEFIILYLQKR